MKKLKKINMKSLEELEKAYEQLGKEIELLKKQKFEYPIYCKEKNSSLVVRFDGLESGRVVVQSVSWCFGKKTSDWIKHTDTDVWEVLPFNKEKGLFHKQLVWCWDNNEHTHVRHLKFYDAINNNTFCFDGTMGGNDFKNIEPFIGEYPQWALEAIQTLES